MTLFYASIDAQKRKIEWVGAGHPPALLFTPLTKEFVLLSGTGLVLGVDPHHTYQKNCRANLPDGTIILIGSDGLWELKGEDGGPIMRESITDLVVKHQHDNAAILAEAVKNMVNKKAGRTALEDDVTLVVAKFGSSAKSSVDKTRNRHQRKNRPSTPSNGNHCLKKCVFWWL